MGDDVNTSARSVADKVMALLHALGSAGEPLRLAALSEVSGTSKATARSLLLDLCSQGYAHSPARGLYTPGPRLQGLAAAVVRYDPLGGVIADSLGALARATGHIAARVSAADGRAVVLGLENPQRLPLPLRVGDELPAHAVWSEAGEGAPGAQPGREPIGEYPTASSWMLAAPTDVDRTTFLVLVGMAFLRPQDDSAAQLLAGHARALGESMDGLRDVG
ncbi:helix-turn-helix domain-containing protein [Brachybacterium alimentarium]|uniref:helix-turn-helix domain-containing protein n=1 Tax=Brachybacterium alimentarium TaxID=47845 RepID=UPI003FD5FACF